MQGFIGQQYGVLGLNERGRKEIFKGIAMLKNVRTDVGFLYLGHLYGYLQYIKEPRADSNRIYLGYARKALAAYQQVFDSTKRSYYSMIGYGNLGMCLIYVQRFDEALTAMDSVLVINQGKNKYIAGNAYMNKGEIYRQLKQIDSAEVSFKKAELYFKDQGFLSEEKILFNALADVYRTKGDSINTYRYRAAAMATDNKQVRSNLSATTKLLKSDYQEKSNLVNTYNGLGIMAGVILLALILTLFFLRRSFLRQRKTFRAFRETWLAEMALKTADLSEANETYLLESSNATTLKSTTLSENAPAQTFTADEEGDTVTEADARQGKMSEATELKILRGLDEFENTHGYLEKGLTLKKLADAIDTNHTYLTQVIKQHRDTGFNNYVNELRVNYLLRKLETDPLFRQYKIAYLAETIGFSSPNALATVFKEITGVSPSSYLSLLGKEERA